MSVPSKPAQTTLVVGASQAGLQLAETLREVDPRGAVTLVGAEPHLPYQRPPLTKGFLTGATGPDAMTLRNADYFVNRGIDLVLGDAVTRLELADAARGSGRAWTVSGREVAFERLALTVGGSPRMLGVEGVTLQGVHHVRDLDDVIALRRDLDAARHVVIVGGGFIGLETAIAARLAGNQVTVVEANGRLMARTVAPVVSQFYADAHRRRGVKVMLGAAVTAIEGASRVEAVTLADGRQIPADVVVVGIGLVPRTDLAEQLELECRDGIVVDAQARTSTPAVVAAGDCATVVDGGGGTRRLESVNNAIVQARVAASTLVGVSPPPMGAPWFWSDQGDLKLQCAGARTGRESVVVRGDVAGESFAAMYFAGDRLVGIDAVNSARDFMAVRRILDAGGSVPRRAAADASVPLRDFIGVSV